MFDKNIVLMITVILLIFGALTFSLIAVLVGLLGARRKIDFGWSYLISILTTPFVGLVVTLLFDKLPDGKRKWGCLGFVFAIFTVIIITVMLIYIVLSLVNSGKTDFLKSV